MTNLGSQTEFLKQQLSRRCCSNIECARSVIGNIADRMAAGSRHMNDLTPCASYRDGHNRLAGKEVFRPFMESMPFSECGSIEPYL